ncbi:hypothetical protein H5410_063898 [Solanum commersonii]|uniref:Uncharacterized protein n=1 Tax=Solanum commersonii TaxID=4109 RepID=A0A9J5WFY0_SOLCO|nr:hypothetical protein H5410_063898 [Solanum commersonii]
MQITSSVTQMVQVKIPWNIRIIVEDTLVLMKDATINIKHIYREGTSLAYYLANHAFEVEGR